MSKLKLLKMTLYLGALYSALGAVAHYFGLTFFPFYDGSLYTPYHDSLLALLGVVLVLFLIAIARDPIKNIDTLKVVIIGALLASTFSVVIIWKVDFAALGAPAKRTQTIVEGVLGFIFTGALLCLYPRKKNGSTSG